MSTSGKRPEEDKGFRIVWAKWMTLGCLAIGFFAVSYIFFATSPEYADCKSDSISLSQVFHMIWGCGFTIASMLMICWTIFEVIEEHN
jgi:hypothetical protein